MVRCAADTVPPACACIAAGPRAASGAKDVRGVIVAARPDDCPALAAAPLMTACAAGAPAIAVGGHVGATSRDAALPAAAEFAAAVISIAAASALLAALPSAATEARACKRRKRLGIRRYASARCTCERLMPAAATVPTCGLARQLTLDSSAASTASSCADWARMASGTTKPRPGSGRNAAAARCTAASAACEKSDPAPVAVPPPRRPSLRADELSA